MVRLKHYLLLSIDAVDELDQLNYENRRSVDIPVLFLISSFHIKLLMCNPPQVADLDQATSTKFHCL